MKNYLLKISIAVLLLIPAKLFAQFTLYNTTNSLLINNSISCLYTSNNNIWMSTAGGLDELSNGNWTSLTTLNSNMPSNPGVIMIDGSNLWGSFGPDNGVASYNGTTWSDYTPSNSSCPTYDPEGIAADSSGKIWFGSHDEGIFSYNAGTWTDYNPGNSGNPDYICYCLTTDKNNTLWFGTHDVGLVQYDGLSFTTYGPGNSNEPDDQIYSIAYDKVGGDLWLGTGTSGVVKYDGTTFTTYNTLNSNLTGVYIRALAVAPNGDVWAGTYSGGLCKYVASTNTWTPFDTSNSNLPSNNVQGVVIDNSGNVWAGTYGGGLAELKNYYTGINVIANDIHAVTIFPNPTDGAATVQFQSNYSGQMQIKVLNVLGQEVLLQNMPVTTGNNSTTINISKDSRGGVYFIQFTINGQSFTKKLVKD